MAGPAIISDEPGPDQASVYAWVVFALSFGLLMSDHMSRQTLGAVGPLIKAQWALSNKELASLSSVVALAVGVMSLPLSLAADRIGRVRSLVAMATLWSLATLAGAWVQSYPQMLVARLLVGVGEAAYGSVGLAVVLAAFPVRMRATLSSSFLAGSAVGQMIGVALGARIAAIHGWRATFSWVGAVGLVLALAYMLVVRESRLGPVPRREPIDWPALARQLLGNRLLLLVYFCSGIQLYCTATLSVFMPILLTRYYGMSLPVAGQTTAVLLLTLAVGMVLCGILADRLAQSDPTVKPRVAIGFSLFSASLFAGAFLSPPGQLQLVLIGGAMLSVAGVAGICGAMTANLTPRAVHGTAMALLALSNNLLGLAPGPFITGWLSDRIGLLDALKVLPVPCLLAAAGMALVHPLYRAELQRKARPGGLPDPA